ncbi:MAG: VCBS domain-containing protein [Burkholderiaceae bacterium]
MPVTGADGGANPDGLTISGATFLGSPVETTVITLTATDILNGTVSHPFYRDATGASLVTIQAGYQAGDQLIVIDLPLGSYGPAQQPLQVVLQGQVDADADAGTALNLAFRGGFRYGADALDNPQTDPTVQGALSTLAITPQVYRVNTTYLSEELERATGPNFLTGMRIDLDLAAGQTLTNLDFGALLADMLQYAPITGTPGVIGDSAIGAGWTNVNGVLVSAAATDGATPSAITPGGAVSRVIGSQTGTSATVDASMVVQFYVPEFDASSNVILDPATGDTVPATAGATVTAGWDPGDVRDPTITPSLAQPNAIQFEAQSITVDKDQAVVVNVGVPEASPGDVIEYTLDINVSDYFAFGGDATPAGGAGSRDFLLTDTLSDGLELLDATTAPSAANPQLQVTSADGTVTPVTLVRGTHYTVTTLANGQQQVVFNLRSTVGTPAGAIWIGDLFGADNTQVNGMTAQLVFRAQVLENYRVNPSDSGGNPVPGSGELSLNEGDWIANRAVIEATVLDATLDPDAVGLFGDGDDTLVNAQIATNAVTIELYRQNGAPLAATPALVGAGDTVTYRLTYTIPSGDFENFALDTFVPRPVIDVTDPDANGTPSGWSAAGAFTDTPLAGQFTVRSTGGDGTPVATPTLSIDPVSNGLNFDFGDRSDLSNTPLLIEVFFTARLTDEPFAPGLRLAAQAVQAGRNTASEQLESAAIDQFILAGPDVSIIKGAVQDDVNRPTSVYDPAYTNSGPAAGIRTAGDPGANPLIGTLSDAQAANLDMNISNIDAGDQIRFALVITNEGNGPRGAFDVRFRDQLPANIDPASVAHLRVVRGDGTTLSVTGDLRAAGGGALANEAAAIAALFGPGLELIDPEEATPGAGGALPAGVDGSGAPRPPGTNVLLVTYDATVRADAPANTMAQNPATLTNFAAVENGTDYTTEDRIDQARVTTALPALSKTFVSSDQAHTSDNNGGAPGLGDVAVGEIVRYQVQLRVPEGTTPSAQFVDTLDPGLSFVSLDPVGTGVVASAGVSFDSGNVFATTVPSNSGTGGVANRVTFSLGTITNTNTDNAQPDTLTFTYTALVTDTAQVNNGTLLNNRANVTYTGGNTGNQLAPDMRVVEPALTISSSPSVSSADAGDLITYTITLAGGGLVAGYDVALADNVPAGMTYVPGSLTQTGGPANLTLTEAGGAISGTWAVVAPSDTITVTFQATVDNTVIVGQTLDHTATATWTSLPGPATNLSPYVASGDTERSGAGGVDDYVASDTAPVAIDAVTPELFVVNTSEASSVTRLVPGEVVRYRAVLQIPEGSSPGTEVRPSLPAGLRYVNDGSTTIAFVANDGGTGIDSSTLIGVSLDQIGGSTTAPDIAGITPVLALDPSAITDAGGSPLAAGPLASGADPVFRLGNLVNSDTDADREFVIIEFNAIVENEAGSTVSTPLPVNFDYFAQGAVRGTSNTDTQTVDQPAIFDLDKRVVNVSGNVVTFEATFTNTGGQTAHDVRLFDDFAGATNIDFTAATALPGAATDNSTATALDVRVPSLASGASVTVQYTATVPSPLDEVPSRDAIVTYTSLGAAGVSLDTALEDAAGTGSTVTTTTTGERTGSNADYGGAVNTFRDNEGAGLATMRGRLWDDSLSQNTVIEGTENVLDGVTVQLRSGGVDGILGNLDDVTTSTTTNALGEYTFSLLPAGPYRITVPTTVTDADSGALAIQFDRGTGPGNTVLDDGLTDVVLSEGELCTDHDFGYVKVNAAPTVTSALASASVDEDAVLTLAGANAITIADPDLAENFNPATPPSNFQVVLGVSDGALTVTGAGATVITGNGTGGLTLVGSVADINATLDGLRYQGNLNFNGTDQIAVTVNDRGNYGDADGDGIVNETLGDALTASTTINLTINPMPDPPVPVADARTIDEDVTVGGNLVAPGAAQIAAGDNTDTDPDFPNGDVITVTGVAAGNTGTTITDGTGVGAGGPVAGTYGSLQVDANGVYTYVPGPAANTLGPGDVVTDVFTYTITDTQANSRVTTFTVTLNGQNDPPAALPDTRSVGEDDPPLAGNALAGNGVAGGQPGDVADTDPEGDSLTVVGVQAGTPGGAVSGGLNTTINGTYGDLVLQSDGTYTYTTNLIAQALNAGQTVQDVFTYSVSDPLGQLATTTITIDVSGANDNLTANPDQRTINEPVDPLAPVPLTGNVVLATVAGEQTDTDIDGDPITVTAVQAGLIPAAGPGGLNTDIQGGWGVLRLQADGSYSYLPDPVSNTLAQGQSVDDVFTYTVTDGTGSASTRLTITLVGENDAPTANPDVNAAPADGSAPALGQAIDASAPGDQADADPDSNDTLTVVGVVPGNVPGATVGNVATPLAGTYGTLTLQADGSYSYTADALDPALLALTAGQSLTDQFSYTVSDGQGGQAVTTITITLNGLDNPPQGADRAFVISEDLVNEGGVPLAFSAADFGFSDPDAGDSLGGVRLDTLPGSGQLLLGGVPVTAGQFVPVAKLGSLAFTPAPDSNNQNLAALPQLRFSVADAGGLFDPVSNTLTIDILLDQRSACRAHRSRTMMDASDFRPTRFRRRSPISLWSQRSRRATTGTDDHGDDAAPGHQRTVPARWRAGDDRPGADPATVAVTSFFVPDPAIEVSPIRSTARPAPAACSSRSTTARRYRDWRDPHQPAARTPETTAPAAPFVPIRPGHRDQGQWLHLAQPAPQRTDGDY